MTKLMQWLAGGVLFLAVWLGLLLNLDSLRLQKENEIYIYGLPVLAVIAFGGVSALIVLYRVLTFNDCEKAADELKAQLVEAKKDLTSKGFKFR